MDDTVVFNDLADKYRLNKNKAIENILVAGKILSMAKAALSHGQFGIWLRDFRVSESERTSQRLLAIHNDFGHLLDHEDKLSALDGLGMTSLLELKKLPDRFRKEIEFVVEDEGEEKRVVKSVIDEDKLSDFLETTVDFKGSPVKVRDLPVGELNKQVMLVQGKYEPDSWGDRNDEYQEVDEGDEVKEVPNVISPVCQATTLLSGVIGDCHSLLPLLDKVDAAIIAECSDDDVVKFKEVLKSFMSNFEAIYLKVKTVEVVV